ncbi:MAG: ABC transporter permease [Peptococcaceae bacterium]|nr:ABC transporter permease [Peptococcaceae bacterium]
MTAFFEVYGKMLANSILTHIFYVFVSVSIGFCLGLALGILLTRIPKYSQVILPVISVFQTIPGIVFIGTLFLYIGMVPLTVIIALAIYAMFPVLKNTYVGIMNVEPQYTEAARGLGMSNSQVLFQVELPLAMPTIIAGLRMSTVYTVSWAVRAAMIGLGGLGDFIYRGISSNNNTLIIAGAIPAAILAVILGLLIDRLQKKAVPRGLRKGGAAK